MDDCIFIMTYQSLGTGFLNHHILDMDEVLEDDYVVKIGSSTSDI